MLRETCVFLQMVMVRLLPLFLNHSLTALPFTEDEIDDESKAEAVWALEQSKIDDDRLDAADRTVKEIPERLKSLPVYQNILRSQTQHLTATDGLSSSLGTALCTGILIAGGVVLIVNMARLFYRNT